MAHLRPYLGKKPIWVVLSITIKKKSELRRQKRRWAPLADSHPVLMVPFAAGFRQTFTVCLSVPGLFCS